MAGDTMLKFFLATNTPQGYISKFDEFTPTGGEFITYILKGAPSSGKSTIIKKLSSCLMEKGIGHQLIYCPNNRESLDGLICYEKNFALADGTYPHIINPIHPQSVHRVVSLYDCNDNKLLHSCRYALIDSKENITRCNKYCQRFLSASGQLMNDSYQIALEATDAHKIGTLARRTASREFKSVGRASLRGREYLRFLSAITKEGIIMHHDTPKILSENIYLLEDDYGASSKLFLSAMRSYALEAGLDVYSCYCPLFPYTKLEHIFIPKLSLGFMTTNKYHPLDINPYKVINARRFTQMEEIKSRKKRISFNKKSAFQLLDQAFLQLEEISQYNQEMASIYTSATDYTMVEGIGERLIKEILS